MVVVVGQPVKSCEMRGRAGESIVRLMAHIYSVYFIYYKFYYFIIFLLFRNLRAPVAQVEKWCILHIHIDMRYQPFKNCALIFLFLVNRIFEFIIKFPFSRFIFDFLFKFFACVNYNLNCRQISISARNMETVVFLVIHSLEKAQL